MDRVLGVKQVREYIYLIFFLIFVRGQTKDLCERDIVLVRICGTYEACKRWSGREGWNT